MQATRYFKETRQIGTLRADTGLPAVWRLGGLAIPAREPRAVLRPRFVCSGHGLPFLLRLSCRRGGTGRARRPSSRKCHSAAATMTVRVL